MQAAQIQTTENRKPVRSFFDFAALLALISAVSYAVGASYYFAYFKRLAIPATVDLSPGLLIKPVALVFIPFTAVILFIILFHDRPTSVTAVLWTDIPVFLVIAGLVYVALNRPSQISASGQSLVWVYWTLAAALSLNIVVDVVKRSALPYEIWHAALGAQLLYAAVVLLLVVASAITLGSTSGAKILQGRYEGATSVMLVQEPGGSLLPPGPYVLAYADAGSYYLIEIKDPMPARPDVLIVPRSRLPAVIVNSLP